MYLRHGGISDEEITATIDNGEIDLRCESAYLSFSPADYARSKEAFERLAFWIESVRQDLELIAGKK